MFRSSEKKIRKVVRTPRAGPDDDFHRQKVGRVQGGYVYNNKLNKAINSKNDRLSSNKLPIVERMCTIKNSKSKGCILKLNLSCLTGPSP
jgi:hypothetical protein